VVPPDSHGISRAPCYLGTRSGGAVVFAYGGVTLCAGPFAWPSADAALCHSLPERQPRLNGPTTPNTQRLPAFARTRFSLIRFRSPLLTESRLLSLPVGNEMFHFPTFPPHTLCVQVRVTGHDSCRVSPFGHPRIKAWLTAPRGLSQPPTSFFGSWCQGIHRAPLLTWPQRCSRPLCSSQDTDGAAPCPPRTSGWTPYGERAVRTHLRGPANAVPGAGGARWRQGTGQEPAPSGPNSVPRPSLPPFDRSGRRSCGCTGSRRGTGRPTGQCSTLKLHSGTIGRTWVWTHRAVRTPYGAPGAP